MTLYEHRINKILSVLNTFKAKKIIDFGCGNGKLVQHLSESGKFECFACVEISKKRVAKLKRMFSSNNTISVFEQSFFEYNSHFCKYDCAILSEVIEHLNEKELSILFDLILNQYSPKLLIITTPNRTYNEKLLILHNGLRHASHIFELSVDDLKIFLQKLKDQYPRYAFFEDFCDPDQATHLIVIEKRN